MALLASQKELGDILIFDIPQAEGMVKGKALDLMQLRPHDGYDSNLSGSANFSDLANADVVAITAGIPRKPGMTREDLLSTNIKIISNVAENVKKYAPKAFVIVVSNPLDAIVYAFHKVSGFTKKMVVGMAGALDNARFRTFIAMETGLSVQDISCIVMGGHGPTMVPITRTASVGGVPLTDLLSQDKIDSIVTRVQEAGTELVKLYGKGSAFFSPAAAIAEMIESYIKDKKRLIPSAAYCEGEYGINGYFIGVPAIIGCNGVEKILEISLTKKENGQLEKTLQQVKVTVLETGL